MSLRDTLFTPAEQTALFDHTFLARERLEEQYASLPHQSETAAFGMWVFLATEVMFFGTLFLAVGAYWCLDPQTIERASLELNWKIGSINTFVLLLSSLMMVLAIHATQLNQQKQAYRYLLITAGLGICFLGFKAVEYYIDYRENLIPGFKFDDAEWIARGVDASRIGYVKIFLFLYWVMTGFHALHVTIGIVAVIVMAVLTRRGRYSREYYSPLDVTGLYWHFVDVVWIFLFPTLYLLGTHTL
ncbi:MAG TPA: cytochrome c oxidase subunit 3 [Planctomycetaceae bacterium]|nr:cytochrome c oxidase subunit 3 [Planctomycetaceae bacterium]